MEPFIFLLWAFAYFVAFLMCVGAFGIICGLIYVAVDAWNSK